MGWDGSNVLESSWNVMAHGDARVGKWRGSWRMERVDSTLTLPRNTVYPALIPLMRTPRLPVVDWTDAPARFKWTRPFRRKTKSGFCACAITFQKQSTTLCNSKIQIQKQVYAQTFLIKKCLLKDPSETQVAAYKMQHTTSQKTLVTLMCL